MTTTATTPSKQTQTVPQRVIGADGVPVDVFSLPTDQDSLEALLRDLFTNHWYEITFGPIIEGAAWEIHAPGPPTKISLLDGYLTIAFGLTHFHICIGETKGPRNAPTSAALAQHRRTHRAELYRRIGKSCVPLSWGIRLFNGADEQQVTILLPNPFLDPEMERITGQPDWSRLALWDRLRARWLGFTEPDPIDRQITGIT